MVNIQAILVIDVQNALCEGDGATSKAMDIIANINKVIRKARLAKAPVIFVQHETPSGLFTRGSYDWQLSNALDTLESDVYLRKATSDAFLDTELKERLDALKIKHLVICGMQSEFCVDSTIRRSLALGYTITVVADGHTTVDNKVLSAHAISEHHNDTWENITSYPGKAITTNAEQIEFKVSI